MKKLSGADWIRAFLGSSSTADLSMQFCPGVERFIKALKKGECLWDAAFARRTRIKPPAYGGNAIDRDISWRGILKIEDKNA